MTFQEKSGFFKFNYTYQISKIFFNLSRYFRMLGGTFLKMWQMDIFIRHKCGERKNIAGHRWIRIICNKRF
jgi:hypothetical protein